MHEIHTHTIKLKPAVVMVHRGRYVVHVSWAFCSPQSPTDTSPDSIAKKYPGSLSFRPQHLRGLTEAKAMVISPPQFSTEPKTGPGLDQTVYGGSVQGVS
jgi:hypothetical protein